MNLTLNVPLNSVSFGQCSTSICLEIYKRGLSPNIFVIGQPDISCQKQDNDFNLWLQSCINKAAKCHKRSYPTYRLWHLNDCLSSYGEKQGLHAWHETDQITDEEINAINNQHVTFVSSQYTKGVFEEFGGERVVYCPIGFDSHNFYKTNKIYFNNDVTLWSFLSKREARKSHDRVTALWVKKYGNNRNHQLNLAIYNPFFVNNGRQMTFEEQKMMFIQQVFGGKNWWNVNFIDYQPTNAGINDIINASHINLNGLSLLEGFNIPLFTSLCLGKHAVVLNAHVHKDYCNKENSVLIEPTSKIPANDGLFFRPGERYNQGNWFNFTDDAVIAGMEKVAELAHTPNVKGEELKQTFTYKRTVDIILENLLK